jgi:hypothetical protein
VSTSASSRTLALLLAKTPLDYLEIATTPQSQPSSPSRLPLPPPSLLRTVALSPSPCSLPLSLSTLRSRHPTPSPSPTVLAAPLGTASPSSSVVVPSAHARSKSAARGANAVSSGSDGGACASVGNLVVYPTIPRRPSAPPNVAARDAVEEAHVRVAGLRAAWNSCGGSERAPAGLGYLQRSTGELQIAASRQHPTTATPHVCADRADLAILLAHTCNVSTLEDPPAIHGGHDATDWSCPGGCIPVVNVQLLLSFFTLPIHSSVIDTYMISLAETYMRRIVPVVEG